MCVCYVLFFFKQKTAYELRSRDWSSDVCSSDLAAADVGNERRAVAGGRADRIEREPHPGIVGVETGRLHPGHPRGPYRHGAESVQIGRASCRARVGPYV